MGTDSDCPRLFLIDGYALIYRAYFALLSRPLYTSDGINTNAPWVVTRFLEKLKREHQPEYLGMVLDAGDSNRKELYPEYKATREKMPDEMRASIPFVIEIVEALGIPVVRLEGFEADDVIGTLAKQAESHGLHTVIVSGDKDFLQLVRPKVSLLNPGRGGVNGMEAEWVDESNAIEKLGVEPGRIIDYLALIGDASDNVPGARGIGPKTAVTLIREFGGVDDILKVKDRVKGKRAKDALAQYEEEILLSRQLVTIQDDLPVDLDPPSLRVSEPERDSLVRIFERLEMETLKELFEKRGPDYVQGSLF